MLDLDHPRTPHIFGAAAHLGRVFSFCKELTLLRAPARLSRLAAISAEFAALHELNHAQE